MDVLTKSQRHHNMVMIKNKETVPEKIVRSFLFSNGFRYRKNDKRYPGKPDIVLPKYKTVIFINGCFWHHHKNCKYFVWPTSNIDYWKQKITDNEKRDENNYLQLRKEGFNIIVIWECELKQKEAREKRLSQLLIEIRSEEIRK